MVLLLFPIVKKKTIILNDIKFHIHNTSHRSVISSILLIIIYQFIYTFEALVNISLSKAFKTNP